MKALSALLPVFVAMCLGHKGSNKYYETQNTLNILLCLIELLLCYPKDDA